MDKLKQCHLRLVASRDAEPLEGPMTRLGFRERFSLISPKQLVISVAVKVVLLGMVLHYIYR